MGTQYISKERILLLMSWTYFFAFSSLYIQLPGLYGPKGVTPVHTLEASGFPKDLKDFLKKPSILRFVNSEEVNLYDSLEFLVIVNVLISALGIIFVSLRSFQTFLVLWVSYLSVYQYGQVFMYFQWDILLLEAGFLTILLAQGALLILPLPRNASSDHVVMWLFKWLLFRLMFASGVVKLQSLCPTWWDLSALTFHFQSQCLPTPAAYFFHALPEVLLQFGVVATLVIEIIVPFLFFVPFKPVRLFSFYTQVLLQVLIIISGNYNFFNFLTIAICYSLLEDSDLGKKESRANRTMTVPTYIVSFVLIASVFFITYQLVAFKVIDGKITSFKLKFTKDDFKTIINRVMPNLIYISTLMFVFKLVSSLAKAVTSRGCVYKMWNLSMVLLVGTISVCVFTSSLISFTVLDKESRVVIPEQARHVHKELLPLEITHSYGLFRRMTGVPKRPEVVLEGADAEKGPWTKIEFNHKPTDVGKMPTIVAPHQPRLDWQMWFAALSNPQDNEWLYSLIYRLLNKEKSVLQLVSSLDAKNVPKFIRASLYEYEYTNPQESSKLWWVAKRKSDYFTPVNLSSPALTKVVKQNGLLGKEPKASKKTILIDYKTLLREKVGQPKDIYPAILVLFLIKVTQKFFTHH